jgi:hypothetical protein
MEVGQDARSENANEELAPSIVDQRKTVATSYIDGLGDLCIEPKSTPPLNKEKENQSSNTISFDPDTNHRMHQPVLLTTSH